MKKYEIFKVVILSAGLMLAGFGFAKKVHKFSSVDQPTQHAYEFDR